MMEFSTSLVKFWFLCCLKSRGEFEQLGKCPILLGELDKCHIESVEPYTL